MRTLLVPLALTLSFLSTAHCAVQKSDSISENERGATLYRECKLGIKVVDDTKHSEPDEVDTATKCLRYFQGYTEALAAVDEPTKVCLPDSTTIGTVIHVYVRFMDIHPRYLDDRIWQGTYHALIEAYPCKKKTP
jgi:hypothetical protein